MNNLNSNSTEKLTVSLYIRVSTELQAKEGDSLEEQEKELRGFCDYKGHKILHVFIERGKSGGNTNRPEYQKLIKDIEAKKINAVVVKKLDRLSRSLLDFEQFITLMQNNNVEFISLKENFDTTTAMGKAMLRVALVFAQLEREQTSERIIDVMHYRASAGLHNGGTPPFGYTSVNKELVPYKKEKEVIEVIFKKFLESHSTVSIAKFLNIQGIKNRNNNFWDERRILHILQNPIYKGDKRWSGVVYPSTHPPIVSAQLFDNVQLAIKKGVSNTKSMALLKGLLVCGCCHSSMTPSYSLNRQKKRYYYYRCSSVRACRKSPAVCQIKHVKADVVEKRLNESLLFLLTPAQLLPIQNKVEKYNSEIEKKETALKEVQVNLEGLIQKIKEKKERYLDSLLNTQFLSAERQRINDALNELDIEEKQLRANLYKAQFDLTALTETRISFSQFKQGLLAYKTGHEANEELQQVLRELLKEVIYYPDKLCLSFKGLHWSIQMEK